MSREKLENAKWMIDKLAEGINPLDGTPVPERELINNVRLSRCFFFVSDVLRQVLENGGIKAKAAGKKKKKLPLDISYEKRRQFALSPTPITASEIAKQVSDLREDESMRRLTYSGIAAWLVSVGLLEDVVGPDGKHRKRPTPAGEENGISVVEREGRSGTYEVVVYDTAAQQFLLDNLDGILAELNEEK